MMDALVLAGVLATSPPAAAPNLYAPVSVVTPTETLVYVGGWMYPWDSHDQIWGVFCSPTACDPPVLTIPNGRFNHVNDPSVVWKPPYAAFPGYYLMYHGCSTLYETGNYDAVCYAVSFDGRVWSPSTELVPDAKQPASVVVDDRVLLYFVNDRMGGQLTMADVGYSGIEYSAYRQWLPYFVTQIGQLVNPDVCRDGNGYHGLFERVLAPGRSTIDEYWSADGGTWYLSVPDKVGAAPYVSVGTPGYMTCGAVLYGATERTDSMGYVVRVRVP